MTLEILLSKESDGELLRIQRELGAAKIPSDGYTHSYIRKVNAMIDEGEMCISTVTYRRVYLPTFARAVQRELARRWANGTNATTPMEHIALYAKKTHDLDDATAVDVAYRLHERIDDWIEEIIDEYNGD